MIVIEGDTPQERKRSAFADRYQVGDDGCGQVEWTATKVEAITLAREHRDNHKRQNDPITVRVTDRFHRTHPGRTVFEAKPEGDVWADSHWLE